MYSLACADIYRTYKYLQADLYISCTELLSNEERVEFYSRLK